MRPDEPTVPALFENVHEVPARKFELVLVLRRVVIHGLESLRIFGYPFRTGIVRQLVRDWCWEIRQVISGRIKIIDSWQNYYLLRCNSLYVPWDAFDFSGEARAAESEIAVDAGLLFARLLEREFAGEMRSCPILSSWLVMGSLTTSKWFFGTYPLCAPILASYQFWSMARISWISSSRSNESCVLFFFLKSCLPL